MRHFGIFHNDYIVLRYVIKNVDIRLGQIDRSDDIRYEEQLSQSSKRHGMRIERRRRAREKVVALAL